MDPLSTIQDRADPVFAVDSNHQVVAWSKGCEELLGFAASSVLGRNCYQIICGTDAFANRFCDAHCAVLNMVRHGEPINSFELNLRSATGKTVRVTVAVVVAREAPSQITLFHFLNPLAPVKKEPGAEV
jgi:PAS domain S-box-containing protein